MGRSCGLEGRGLMLAGVCDFERECDVLRELKRFGSPICHKAKDEAAKLLDKEVALHYNACQAITG